MSELPVCERCGRPIPADAPEGQCPICLLALALPANFDADSTLALTKASEGAASADTEKETESRLAGWPVVPGYRIVGELGAGGGGSVYRARQHVANREVALKVLAIGANRVRFEREIRALGSLEHPNVVRVFEVGECSLGPFFSMEIMRGGSLARRIRDFGSLAPREAASIVEKAARGVAAAHQRNVAHRDLKPANILLDANGEPKVADFGLAKEWLGGTADPEGSTLDPTTGSNVFLGTPAFAAPEQVGGSPADDAYIRIDVYGLGATLYQALTGVPPFSGEKTPIVLHRVLTEDPVRPRSRNRDVPPELEAVCLKCLSKSPADRYSSADELADDLARWQRGEATVARPIGPFKRFARWTVKRRKAAAGLAAAIVFTLALVAGISYLLKPDPDAELKLIERELQGEEPVELVREKGLPRWWSFETGAEVFRDSIYTDGVCSFESGGEAIVEVAPARLVPHAYRLFGEVRHDRGGDGASVVGLCFGYRVENPADGTSIARWHRIVFNDHPVDPGPKMTKPPDLFQFQIGASRLEAGEKRLHYPSGMGRLPLNVPSPLSKRPWRRIVIEVRPTGIRAWAGDVESAPKPFSPDNRTSDELSQANYSVDERLYGKRKDQVQHTEWSPAGSIALFVFNGHGSFRKITLQRLNP